MRKLFHSSYLVFVSLLSATAVAAPEAELWVLWDAGDESQQASIDHSPWQRFLDGYVEVGSNGVNLVRYGQVSEADGRALRAYLQTLTQLDPRNYPRAEQLPYWINLYNALTVDVVLAHPGKRSIQRMGKRLFSIGPWDDELISVAGEPLTLNDIEHRILRPVWKDRRIHYALNCASLSCPNLDTQAYTRDNTERLLAANEIAYINDVRGVRFDERGRLVLSQIYEWYVADFAGDRQGLLDYLGGHHQAQPNEIRNHRGAIRYHYDWSLNELANRVRD